MPERQALRDTAGGAFWNALLRAQTELDSADEALREAQDRAALAAGVFATIRDLGTERLGGSPYGESTVRPPFAVSNGIGPGYPLRYVNMRIGTAIEEVLRDAVVEEDGLDLHQIADRLARGGFNYPEKVNLRSVNAALMNLNAVIKESHRKGGDTFRLAGHCLPGSDADIRVVYEDPDIGDARSRG